MKKQIRILSGVCACTMLLTGFAGCKKEDPSKTLYIDIGNAGYGIEWLNPLKETFEAEHEGYTVKISSITKGDNEYLDKAISGTAETDIFFVETTVSSRFDTPITANGVKYDSAFEDLTSLYNTKIPGEEKTIAQKMESTYLAFNTHNGKNYTIPWVTSMQGILVNNKLWKAEWGKFPNTTDELFAFMDAVKTTATPFIYSLGDSYWEDIYDIWAYQYNGKEAMDKFWQGYDGNGERYNPELFLNDGVLEALKVLNRLLKKSNGYASNLSYTLSFTSVQNTFLEGEDNILMCPTGAWIEREMETNYDPEELDIEFVKMPVVSALGTKLGISDEVLSQIIDYVDGDLATAPAFTSAVGLTGEQVIEQVREARSFLASNNLHAAFIPVYSTKKDLAKEFLQLMCSDRGIEMMLSVNGCKPPLEFDIENSAVKNQMSDFSVSTQKMIESSRFYFSKKDVFFNKNNLSYVNNIPAGTPTKAFAAENSKDYQDAETVWSNNYTYVEARWTDFMRQAGLA